MGPCHPLDLSFSRGKTDLRFVKFYGACKLKIPRENGQTYLLSVKMFILAEKEIDGFGFFKKEEMQREVILNLNFGWPNFNSHCH